MDDRRTWLRHRGGCMALVFAVAVLAPGSSVYGQFRLFDDFQDETLGMIDDQDGWSSAGGDNQVVVDPAGVDNQVLYVPSASSVLHKSLLDENVGVPNGTVRMMFFRLRVANKQTFSVGLSGLTDPNEYSDFSNELGMANSAQNLDLRVWDDDGGNYEVLAQLEPDRWYSVWILVNAFLDEYEVWISDVPGAGASAADKLAAQDGDETFECRSGQASDLWTFYIKTSGGSSGSNFGPVHFDDIYLELTNALNLSNPAGGGPDHDHDGDVDLDDYAVFADCMAGPDMGPVPLSTTLEACLEAFDLDRDGDVDLRDWWSVVRGFSG